MFKLNQKGSALTYVIVLAAIVMANTLYLINLNKASTDTNKSRELEVAVAAETRRLGTFLSDASVCGDPLNFGGKTIAAINAAPTSTLTKGILPFLVLNNTYSNNRFRFQSYAILPDPTAPADANKSNSLFVSYSVMKGVVDTGLKKIVKIPLFINYTGATITSCYSDPTENLTTISNVLAAACQGNAASLSGGPPATECLHDVINETCAAATPVLNGVASNANQEDYTCTAFNAVIPSCPSAPLKTYATSILVTNSFTCDDADPGCAAGTMLIMNGGVPTCASTCSGTDIFQRINGAGVPTCYARPKNCPVGEYAKEIEPDGDPICAPYTIKNISCGSGMFATRLDPNGASAALMLGCQAFSKVKTCPAGQYTFLGSLSTTPASCSTYTY